MYGSCRFLFPIEILWVFQIGRFPEVNKMLGLTKFSKSSFGLRSENDDGNFGLPLIVKYLASSLVNFEERLALFTQVDWMSTFPPALHNLSKMIWYNKLTYDLFGLIQLLLNLCNFSLLQKFERNSIRTTQ